MVIDEGVIEYTYSRLSDQDIKKLALAIYRGEVLTSMQIREYDQHLLPNIFMPLLLMDKITSKQLLVNKITVFWEYMSAAGPQSINGYPMFTSFSAIDRQDAERVVEKFNTIVKLMDGL
jgi:hypothetical protein